MLHPLGYVEGKFAENLESFKGPQGCCIFSQEFYETIKSEKFKRGYTIQVLRGSGPMETALSLYKFKKIKFGRTFHKNFLIHMGIQFQRL